MEEKYPDCGDIAGDIADTFEMFEAGSFISGSYFLPDECARDIHRKACLGDSSFGATPETRFAGRSTCR